MLLLTENAPNVLNFIVTGQARCGAAVIQSAVSSHPKAICHGDLVGDCGIRRQEAHEDYFGEPYGHAEIPDYCAPGMVSPEQYLTIKVFDNPLYGEQAVGVRILYDDILKQQMWEYFQEWNLAGDFCVIHVKRNPIACFVSKKQAQQTGVWQQSVNDRQQFLQPRSVHVDVEELTWFVRNHVMCETKIANLWDDRLEFTYKELFLDYPSVMAGVFEFLSLPPYPEAKPTVRRLKNRNIRDRIANFSTLRARVPSDVASYFNEDLF